MGVSSHPVRIEDRVDPMVALFSGPDPKPESGSACPVPSSSPPLLLPSKVSSSPRCCIPPSPQALASAEEEARLWAETQKVSIRQRKLDEAVEQVWIKCGGWEERRGECVEGRSYCLPLTGCPAIALPLVFISLTANLMPFTSSSPSPPPG